MPLVLVQPSYCPDDRKHRPAQPRFVDRVFRDVHSIRNKLNEVARHVKPVNKVNPHRVACHKDGLKETTGHNERMAGIDEVAD